MDLLHIKAFIADDQKAIDEENKSILFSIPEIVDREDEIVTAQAIIEGIGDKKNFAANPICLPCHQHRLEGGQPPCVGSWDVETAKKLANTVNVNLRFAVGTKLGDEYWNCYKNKHMRAISIGFRALEWAMEDRKGRQVRVITKIILYEISCVAVGCNPGALSKLKAQFGWEEKDIPQNAKEYFDGKFLDIKKHIDEKLEEIQTLLIPDQDGLAKHLLLAEGDIDQLDPAEKDIDDEQFRKAIKTM